MRRRWSATRLAFTLTALVSAHITSIAAAQPLPASSLAMRVDGRWKDFWSARRAPVRWSAPDAALVSAVRWHPVADGAEWAELAIAGSGEAWRLRVVLLRLTPTALRLSLEQRTRDYGTLGAWSIDSTPAVAIAAFNAGQFTDGDPWGWLVREGEELQPPRPGPLSMAVVVEAGGALHLAPPDSIQALRESRRAVLAFQSYPTLLTGNGDVPRPLRTAGAGIDVTHRDSRLAIGELRDGRVLVALTRFDGLDGALSALPFGPTIPEMSALMGALGCRRAVSLDGGISGQMVLGDSGRRHRWPGMRMVPLALVAAPRATGAVIAER